MTPPVNPVYYSVIRVFQNLVKNACFYAKIDGGYPEMKTKNSKISKK